MAVKENTVSYAGLLQSVFTNKITLTISFAVLTAIAAQIAVPVKPVPFTLQAMMVVLAGAFLGARYGMYSQVLYLAMGAIGLPVFAQVPDAAVGFARLFGPTGGYLLAFPLAAFATGYLIEKNKSYIGVVIFMFLGNAIIIAAGAFYLNLFFIKDIYSAIIGGAAIFSLWTVVKVFAAAAIYFSFFKIKEKKS